MVHASACAVQRNNRKVQRCGCCLQPLPLRGFDEECRGFIAEQYEVTGLNIHSQSTPTRIEKQSDGSLTLHVKKKDGQEEAIEGLETILMATGRSPNTQNMNLEKVSSRCKMLWCWIVICANPPESMPHIAPTTSIALRLMTAFACESECFSERVGGRVGGGVSGWVSE